MYSGVATDLISVYYDAYRGCQSVILVTVLLPIYIVIFLLLQATVYR